MANIPHGHPAGMPDDPRSPPAAPLYPTQTRQTEHGRPSLAFEEVESEKTTFPPLEPYDSVNRPEDGFTYEHRTHAQPSNAHLKSTASKFNDDIELLRAERAVSQREASTMGRSKSRRRSTSHSTEDRLGEGDIGDIDDVFNQPTFKDAVREHKEQSNNRAYKFWLYLKKFPRIFRYFLYLIPGAALLLIPVLIGAKAVNKKAHSVGGVYLMWFGIWLEIVWGALWISRMFTSLMPHLFLGIAKMFGSTNAKKWKDIGAQLELHVALFFWMLAVLISFMPTNNGHRVNSNDGNIKWISILNKIIIAIFVLATLNMVEKVLIQCIATTFHQRTYATRIENHKSDVRNLITLFEYAKIQMVNHDEFLQKEANTNSNSGTQTPMNIGQNARQVFGAMGDVAVKVGADFVGKKTTKKGQSKKVVAELLRAKPQAYALARLIHRALTGEEDRTAVFADMEKVFPIEEDAETAFNMFDRDLNGDISMEEAELVVNDISLEKKAIAASLKDLDSVIQKLDKVFMFIIVVIAIIVFISIISGSAAAGLTSAGTSVLGLAWMLQATAQEFLQSIIFVFVKHPFDVGDRVTIYGATGINMTGDDYHVTAISLLYTEFRKMEGHIVQAPNSILNTLFILNQRRSNGLADPVSLTMRFGTPAWMVDELKGRMKEFCLANKRDYKSLILTEMRTLEEVRSCTMNIIFFHKTSFQNELLRLNRHNRFVTELMKQMVDIGIQSPYRAEPGGSRDHPLYWAGLQQPPEYVKNQTQEHLDYASTHPPARHMSQRRASVSGFRPGESVPQTITEEAEGYDFEDITQDRPENSRAHRLASKREARARRETLAPENHGDNISGSSTALEAAASHDSRNRFLGRARTVSRSRRGQHTSTAHYGMGNDQGEIV